MHAVGEAKPQPFAAELIHLRIDADDWQAGQFSGDSHRERAAGLHPSKTLWIRYFGSRLGAA